jgi:hypothetical protein
VPGQKTCDGRKNLVIISAKSGPKSQGKNMPDLKKQYPPIAEISNVIMKEITKELLIIFLN